MRTFILAAVLSMVSAAAHGAACDGVGMNPGIVDLAKAMGCAIEPTEIISSGALVEEENGVKVWTVGFTFSCDGTKLVCLAKAHDDTGYCTVGGSCSNYKVQ